LDTPICAAAAASAPPAATAPPPLPPVNPLLSSPAAAAMFPAPRQPAGTLVLAVTALLGGLLLAWLRMLRRAVAAYAYLWPLVLMERTRLQAGAYTRPLFSST